LTTDRHFKLATYNLDKLLRPPKSQRKDIIVWKLNSVQIYNKNYRNNLINGNSFFKKNPMRITKKFAGILSIGKQVYVRKQKPINDSTRQSLALAEFRFLAEIKQLPNGSKFNGSNKATLDPDILNSLISPRDQSSNFKEQPHPVRNSLKVDGLDLGDIVDSSNIMQLMNEWSSSESNTNNPNIMQHRNSLIEELNYIMEENYSELHGNNSSDNVISPSSINNIVPLADIEKQQIPARIQPISQMNKQLMIPKSNHNYDSISLSKALPCNQTSNGGKGNKLLTSPLSPLSVPFEAPLSPGFISAISSKLRDSPLMKALRKGISINDIGSIKFFDDNNRKKKYLIKS